MKSFIFAALLISLWGCAQNNCFDEHSEGPFQKGQGQLTCRMLTADERTLLGKPADQVIFTFETKGFKEGDEYFFGYGNINKEVNVLGEYYVNNSGDLISKKNPSEIINKKMMNVYGCANGELIAYFLISKDGSKKTMAVIVPNPICATWSDGAHISVIADDPTFSYFSIEGNGFGCNEELAFSSFVDDEVIKGEMHCQKGRCACVLAPATLKNHSGSCKIKIKRISTGEEKTLDFSYGIKAKGFTVKTEQN